MTPEKANDALLEIDEDMIREAAEPPKRRAPLRRAAWIAAAHANQSGLMVSIAPTVREGLMILFR